jgi:hypothetical protein
MARIAQSRLTADGADHTGHVWPRLVRITHVTVGPMSARGAQSAID